MFFSSVFHLMHIFSLVKLHPSLEFQSIGERMSGVLIPVLKT